MKTIELSAWVISIFKREVVSVTSLGSSERSVNSLLGQDFLETRKSVRWGTSRSWEYTTWTIESEQTWNRRKPDWRTRTTPSDCGSAEVTGLSGTHWARREGATVKKNSRNREAE